MVYVPLANALYHNPLLRVYEVRRPEEVLRQQVAEPLEVLAFLRLLKQALAVKVRLHS